MRYILLDRDGVINHDSEDYIKSPAEWIPIENSLEAIALLNKHDYKVIIITNQSGVERGLYSNKTLTAIHFKMTQMLNALGGHISHIYYCPHLATANCACRKPKSGLLTQFSLDTGTDLSNLYFIGDSLRDLQAAINVGAKPILVKTGNGLKTLIANPTLSLPIFGNLYDATEYILSTP